MMDILYRKFEKKRELSSAPTYKMGNHVVDDLKVWGRLRGIADKPSLIP